MMRSLLVLAFLLSLSACDEVCSWQEGDTAHLCECDGKVYPTKEGKTKCDGKITRRYTEPMVKPKK